MHRRRAETQNSETYRVFPWVVRPTCDHISCIAIIVTAVLPLSFGLSTHTRDSSCSFANIIHTNVYFNGKCDSQRKAFPICRYILTMLYCICSLFIKTVFLFSKDSSPGKTNKMKKTLHWSHLLKMSAARPSPVTPDHTAYLLFTFELRLQNLC